MPRMPLKVLLINPSQPNSYAQPPMGLASVAAMLEAKGYLVAILDANALRIESKRVAVYASDADVVGLTAMTPTINEAADVARHLKRVRPNLPIILGGAHATLLPEETMAAIPEIDVIVKGEGEQTAIDLLRALELGQPLDSISGISYMRNGKAVNNPLRAPTTSADLDSLPFPAYHLLPQGKYRLHPPYGRALPFAIMTTSRGCPYKCSYCSKPVFGYRFRAMSPERVVEEVIYYKERYGVKEIEFYDDVFTLDKKRAFAIADTILRRGLKMSWTCETRVNLVDRDLLSHMKQAGCYAVAYGIESATQHILDTLNKGATVEQAEKAVNTTREVGIQTIGYFMIGSPGETSDTIKATIEFAKRLRLDYAQFAVTTPFPGTALYNSYLSTGGGDIPWENFTYEGMGRGVIPVFESHALNRADLQYWVKESYKRFYLRPIYLWQRISQLKSIEDLKVNARGLSMLMGNIRPSRHSASGMKDF